MVVVPLKFSVGGPDVRGKPVVYGVGVKDICCYFVSPFQVLVTVVIPVPVDGLPAMVAFLRANPDESTSTLSVFLPVIPFCKFDLKIVVPHLFCVEIKIFFAVAYFGHIPDPQIS